MFSHHGSEHYCPLSLLRVFGKSVVKEYKEHQGDMPCSDENVNVSSATSEDEQTPLSSLKQQKQDPNKYCTVKTLEDNVTVTKLEDFSQR